MKSEESKARGLGPTCWSKLKKLDKEGKAKRKERQKVRELKNVLLKGQMSVFDKKEGENMNRALRDTIKEENENCCQICSEWCADTGSPHHIVKVSEEPLLQNCKMNILWLCFKCHRHTEDVPGYNRELQMALQKKYFKLFLINRFYAAREIAKLVNMPVKDVEKAINKGRVNFKYIDGIQKIQGLEAIRFLMGGKIRDKQ